MIKAETLEKVMIAINKMVQAEGLHDFSKARTDSTETNIYSPTNNSLMRDCIKTFDRLFTKLAAETGGVITARRYKKQAKEYFAKINNTKPGDKRTETFEKQLKLLRTSINKAEAALALFYESRVYEDERRGDNLIDSRCSINSSD